MAWLLPCGRAVLRFASALTLALILTARARHTNSRNCSPPYCDQPIPVTSSLLDPTHQSPSPTAAQVRVPSVTSLSKYDVALALWAAALLESICTQMWHQGWCGAQATTALRGWLADNTYGVQLEPQPTPDPSSTYLQPGPNRT